MDFLNELTHNDVVAILENRPFGESLSSATTTTNKRPLKNDPLTIEVNTPPLPDNHHHHLTLSTMSSDDDAAVRFRKRSTTIPSTFHGQSGAIDNRPRCSGDEKSLLNIFDKYAPSADNSILNFDSFSADSLISARNNNNNNNADNSDVNATTSSHANFATSFPGFSSAGVDAPSSSSPRPFTIQRYPQHPRCQALHPRQRHSTGNNEFIDKTPSSNDGDQCHSASSSTPSSLSAPSSSLNEGVAHSPRKFSSPLSTSGVTSADEAIVAWPKLIDDNVQLVPLDDPNKNPHLPGIYKTHR